MPWKVSTREGALDAVKASLWWLGVGAFLLILPMLGEGRGGLGGLIIGGVTVPVPIPSGGNPFDPLLAGAGFVLFFLGIGQLVSGLYWLVRHR